MKADRDMPTGGSPDNPTSITDLIAAYRAAHRAFGAVHAETVADERTDAYQDAQRRYLAALHAVRAARPTDLAGLAKQLRWLVTDDADLLQYPLGEILANVADRLEAGILLSSDALERLALISDIDDGDGDEQAALVQSLRSYLGARS